jgi:Coenzyme PQQ synthesis protein D (PqqD)
MAMTSVNLTSTISLTSSSVAADVAGETVLMSLERNRCYGLGEIGSVIWTRIQSPLRVDELIARLSEEYEAAPGLIEKDVLHLLAQLADEGLIRIE